PTRAARPPGPEPAMIYDRVKAGRMLRVVLDVTEGALDLAARPGGEPSLRTTALETEKLMRALAAKGDVDAMVQEYLRVMAAHPEAGQALHRRHQLSFESEFYRLVAIHRERD
ncbi:MAG TPA: hypothetical protein VNL37_05895, partial [Candidatus Polarisedimenticolia bacterium]|nr:hypothetical protein [Candidatus Polarisedimenticolia bacterium]